MTLQTAKRGRVCGKWTSSEQRETQQPFMQLNAEKPRETARRGQPRRMLSTRWLRDSDDCGIRCSDEDTSDSEDSQCPGSPYLKAIENCSPVVSEWEGESDEENINNNQPPSVQASDNVEKVIEKEPESESSTIMKTLELMKPKEEDACDEIEVVCVKTASDKSCSLSFATTNVVQEEEEEKEVTAAWEEVSDSDETIVDEQEPASKHNAEIEIVYEKQMSSTGDTWNNLTLEQKLKVKVGLCHLAGWSEDNLVRVDRVLERGTNYVQRYKKFPALDVVLFNKTMDYTKDRIYLFIRDRQCYVALYRSDIMTCYVADGVNSFNTRSDNIHLLIPQEEWRRKIQVKVIEYTIQEYVDEGAVSAIMIMMELQRYYNYRDEYDLLGWPESFTNHPKWYLRELRLRMHKNNTVPVIEPNSVSLNYRRVTHCYCGHNLEFTSWNKIMMHRRTCTYYEDELKRLAMLKESKKRRLED